MEAPIAPRRVVLASLAVLVIGLLFALPASAMLLLTEDQFDQDNPVISGNNIVWLDWRNGISELWLHNLASGMQRGLPLDGAVLNDPVNGFPTVWSVSDRLIAWQDYRNGYSNPKVFIYDLPSGPSPRPAPGSAAQRNPAVWADKVAWVESDVVLLDPAQGERTSIPTPLHQDHRPSFNGGLLAWYAEDPLGVDSVLVVWDISWPRGRSPRSVHAVGSTRANPQILPSLWRDPKNPSTVRMAWAEKRCAESECDAGTDDPNRNIYYVQFSYDGSTFRTISGPRPLTTDPAQVKNQWNARVSGDYVVWTELEGGNIFAHHIPTAKRFVVAAYAGTAAPVLSLDQSNLVWAESVGGNSDAGEVLLDNLAGPRLASSTHPNQFAWFRLPAVFSWTPPLGAAGVQGYGLDLTSTPVPSASEGEYVSCLPICSEGQLTKTFTSLADGVWYFQTRARLSDGNWTPPGSYRFQVDSAPPAVDAGPDRTVIAGNTERFQGTATDTRSGVDAASWSWSFSDGSSAQGMQVEKSFPAAGQYTATVSVRDNAGNSGSDSVAVRVVAPASTDATGGGTQTPAGGTGASPITFSAPTKTLPSAATKKDTSPPKLLRLSPLGEIPLAPKIHATFSEPVLGADSQSFYLQRPNGSKVSARVTYSAADLAATLIPNQALTPGMPYSAQLTSAITDLSGNKFQPTVRRMIASTFEQENSPALSFFWSLAGSRLAAGRKYVVSTTAGARAGISFSGTAVTLYLLNGPDRGTAILYLDGKFRRTLDTYSPRPGRLAVPFRGLRPGKHSISVVVTGKKNRASRGNSIAIDGLARGRSYYQETGTPFTFAWSQGSSRLASGGRYSTTVTTGSTARVVFWGTGIAVYTLAMPGTGGGILYVDGKPRARINASSAKPRLLRTETNGLAPGLHVASVVSFQQRKGAGPAAFGLDAFRVAR